MLSLTYLQSFWIWRQRHMDKHVWTNDREIIKEIYEKLTFGIIFFDTVSLSALWSRNRLNQFQCLQFYHDMILDSRKLSLKTKNIYSIYISGTDLGWNFHYTMHSGITRQNGYHFIQNFLNFTKIDILHSMIWSKVWF